MPYGALFQSFPTHPPASTAFGANTPATINENSDSHPDASAATKLAEAIDNFLGDLETKFQGISDEILTKREFSPRKLFWREAADQQGVVDDMAERCDRLEAELLMKEAATAEGTGAGKGRSEESVS